MRLLHRLAYFINTKHVKRHVRYNWLEQLSRSIRVQAGQGVCEVGVLTNRTMSSHGSLDTQQPNN